MGARGDLDCGKNEISQGFRLKLTPMDTTVSLQLIWVGKRHCRVLRLYNSDVIGIDITTNQDY